MSGLIDTRSDRLRAEAQIASVLSAHPRLFPDGVRGGDGQGAAYQASPALIRVAVLRRRINASPSVAALIGDLAFGHVDRDRAAVVPVLLTDAR